MPESNFTLNTDQIDLFGENSGKRQVSLNAAVETLTGNILEVVERMAFEAKRGNVQAAKLILTVFPKMIAEVEGIDIWAKLQEDYARRK